MTLFSILLVVALEMFQAGMDAPPRGDPPRGEGGVPRPAPYCGEGGVPRPDPPRKNDQTAGKLRGKIKARI